MEGPGIQLLPAFPYTDPLLAAVDTLDQFLQPKLINLIFFISYLTSPRSALGL